MKLYNTLTRDKQEFVPVHENNVGMYVCGPTVYNNIHIGNARPMIVFDVLRRYFLYRGYKVNFVQNFTDIDDKMILKANDEHLSVKAIAKRYIHDYIIDAENLNVLQPDIAPKATEHIGEIISLIKKLEAKGLAYSVDGDVYFDVAGLPDYGKLSGRNLEDLMEGARVEVNETKHNPMDFALWKAQKPNEPAWGSPWGKGRPGWHVECSAMSMKYLGETFDIHGGGVDLVFPHHENEIAQSEGATGKPFVNYWLHNGHINVDNKKMSKSTGNFFTVADVAKDYDLEVVRYVMLTCHYRSPFNFSRDLMESSKAGLKRLYNAKNMYGEGMTGGNANDASEDMKAAVKQLKAGFVESMDDDINTAEALGVIYEFVRTANTKIAGDGTSDDAKAAYDGLMEVCSVLGLLYQDSAIIPQEVLDLVDKRKQARESRDFAMSDKLRDMILELGFVVEDSKDGQKIKAK